jgi:hypothetical protein
MTFLSEQNFDNDGVIKTIIKKRKILDSSETQDDGTIKGKARIKFEYGEFTAADIVPQGNLRGAEGMVLTEGEVFWAMSCPPLNHVEVECRLAHRVCMAISNIGDNSQRGAGNTIVCHPSVREQVDAMFTQMKTVDQYDEETDSTIEVKRPYFDGDIPSIFEDDLVDDDVLLVLYRGENDEDQPLIYVDGAGLLMNNHVAKVEHYGKFVRIP